MKRTSCLIALILASTTLASAQAPQLPRDPEKLIARVQKLWDALTAGQRYKALDFVLPEKRDAFASGSPTPITKAKVIGLDLTTNPNEAVVRVGIDVLSTQSASGFLTWTVMDPWVWRDGNWYLNVDTKPGIFHGNPAQPRIDSKAAQKDIEKNFQILRTEIDLGTMIQGQSPPPLEVPLKYTGDLELSLELGLPNPIASLAVMTQPITSSTKHFVLLVSADNWDGPFSLPLPLKIQSGDAVVERTLVVKGTVFVPLVFRQSPSDGPVPDQEFSIFIRNNTDERVPIHSVVVDGKMDLQKQPEALLPHQEVELVFKPHPDEVPDRLYLQLDTPIQGRSLYTYPIRATRR
jgi:hypothetical protein